MVDLEFRQKHPKASRFIDKLNDVGEDVYEHAPRILERSHKAFKKGLESKPLGKRAKKVGKFENVYKGRIF